MGLLSSTTGPLYTYHRIPCANNADEDEGKQALNEGTSTNCELRFQLPPKCGARHGDNANHVINGQRHRRHAFHDDSGSSGGSHMNVDTADTGGDESWFVVSHEGR